MKYRVAGQVVLYLPSNIEVNAESREDAAAVAVAVLREHGVVMEVALDVEEVG